LGACIDDCVQVAEEQGTSSRVVDKLAPLFELMDEGEVEEYLGKG